ncbi:leucine-rich repeat protein [Treponema sp. OMZ 840]|uniref:leucine-rich repeat protein n=1 Tax=Treponema sp. OMZ 840 TaxID=244313 RepID=UPI003D901BFB
MVEKGKTVVFTASPDPDYLVDSWSITGAGFEADTGTPGNSVAKVNVTGNFTIGISFIPIVYTQVAYTDLENHLATAASAEGVNYIEITGSIPSADFAGEYSNPGVLCQKIKAASSKKVALKLPSTVEGLTDMTYCFLNCENLVSVANIPQTVTNMDSCFYGCRGLTQAPPIPEGVLEMGWCFYDCRQLDRGPDIPLSVTDMRYCFADCISLTGVKLNCAYSSAVIDEDLQAFQILFRNCMLEKGGVKVPSAHYAAYTSAEALTKMQVPGTDYEDKKARFASF